MAKASLVTAEERNSPEEHTVKKDSTDMIFSNLNEDINQLGAKISKVKDIEKELNELRQKLKERDEQIAKSEDDKKNIVALVGKERIEDKRRINELNVFIKNLQKNLAEKEKKISELRKEVEENEQKEDAVKKELENKLSEYKTKEEQLRNEKNSIINNSYEKEVLYQKKVANLIDCINEVKKENEKKTNQVALLQDKITYKEKEIEGLRENIQELKKQIQNGQNIVKEVKSFNSDYIKSKLQQKDNELTSLKNEFKVLQADSWKKQKKLEDNLVQKNSEIDKLKKILNDKGLEFKSFSQKLKTRLDSYEKLVSSQKETNEEMKKEIVEKNKEIDVLKQKLTEKQTKVVQEKELYEKLREKDNLIQKLKSNKESLQGKGNLEEKNKIIHQLKQSIEEKNRIIENLKSNAEKINAQDKLVDDLKQSIKEKQEKLDVLEKRAEQSQKLAESIKSLAKNYASKVSLEVERIHHRDETKIRDLKTKINERNKLISSLEQDLQSMREMMKEESYLINKTDKRESDASQSKVPETPNKSQKKVIGETQKNKIHEVIETTSEEDELYEVLSMIDLALDKGEKIDDIKQSLMSSGYDKKIIEKAYKKLGI